MCAFVYVRVREGDLCMCVGGVQKQDYVSHIRGKSVLVQRSMK